MNKDILRYEITQRVLCARTTESLSSQEATQCGFDKKRGVFTPARLENALRSKSRSIVDGSLVREVCLELVLEGTLTLVVIDSCTQCGKEKAIDLTIDKKKLQEILYYKKGHLRDAIQLLTPLEPCECRPKNILHYSSLEILYYK